MVGKHLTAEPQSQPGSVSLKDSLELVCSVCSWMQPDLVECLLLYISLAGVWASWGGSFVFLFMCLRPLQAARHMGDVGFRGY